MPGMSGLELQQELKRRGHTLPVVVITGHGDISQARTAFKSDAVDFLEKPFDDEQLVAAIEAAALRENDRLALDAQREKSAAAVAALSEREREVLALLARGLANRDIGEALNISPRTVEVHKARIMSKLGVKNLAELVRLADAAHT
jgi:RNA polymerase sigma factor (sigma-70 family)